MDTTTLRHNAQKEIWAAFRRLVNKRKLGLQTSPEMIPFIVEVSAQDIPPWVTDREIKDAVSEGVRAAVVRLGMKSSFTPGQLLARKSVPPWIRSRAARSMRAMRGGRATAAKMKALGYPN
jgi:hypothetical protein